MFEDLIRKIVTDQQAKAQLRHEQLREDLKLILQSVNAGVAILKVICGEVNDLAKRARHADER